MGNIDRAAVGMTVKDLIEALQEFDQDDIVILSKDAEGNGYSPLNDIGIGAYKPINSWSGEVRERELTPYLIEKGYSEQDIFTEDDHAVPCIIFIPTN